MALESPQKCLKLVVGFWKFLEVLVHLLALRSLLSWKLKEMSAKGCGCYAEKAVMSHQLTWIAKSDGIYWAVKEKTSDLKAGYEQLDAKLLQLKSCA